MERNKQAAKKHTEYLTLKEQWAEKHKTPSPTPVPTASPTLSPSTVHKCPCGSTWGTKAPFGGFCILCPAGTYQPNPHDGDATLKCLGCPLGENSNTGSCGCTHVRAMIFRKNASHTDDGF